MKKRHFELFNVTAAITLLLFCLSTFFSSSNIETAQRKVSHSEQLYCTVATSSTLPLAEAKPKLDGFDASKFWSCFISPLLFQEKGPHSFDTKKPVVAGLPRPLWLLNRSLLI